MSENAAQSEDRDLVANARPTRIDRPLHFIHHWMPVLLVASVLLIVRGIMAQIFHTVDVYKDGPTELGVSQFCDWTLGVCLAIASGLLLLSSPSRSKDRRISLSALALLISIHAAYEVVNNEDTFLGALLPWPLQPNENQGSMTLTPLKPWQELCTVTRFILDPTRDFALLIAVCAVSASAVVFYRSFAEPDVEKERQPRQRGFDVIDPH